MFHFSLVTPEKKLVTDVDVEEVIVPAFRGQLTILTGHAPMVTTLTTGTLRFRRAGSTEFEQAVVSWGYCEVSPTGVNILANTAESLDELDKERAELALKRAQKRLTEPNLDADQIVKFQRKLKRALTRIDAAKNDTSH